MTDTTVPTENTSRNTEDYSNSLCWLLPRGEYTIIDLESIPLIDCYKWRVNYQGCGRYPRIVTSLGGKKGLFLHRFILDAPKGVMVDHRNRDTRDNRVVNLRLCTAKQNTANMGSHRNTTSRFRGVHWDSKYSKWVAKTTQPGGRQVYLGSFQCEVEAAKGLLRNKSYNFSRGRMR